VPSRLYLRSASRLTHILVGLVLLGAAALKAHQLATSPAPGESLLSTRWLLTLWVEVEILLGVWLVSGLAARRAWQAAVGCFAVVAVVALASAAARAAPERSAPARVAPERAVRPARGREVEAAGENLIQLNFPENMPVKVLVEYVGQQLGMNILYDESILKKTITISAPTKVPEASLLGLLRSVLKATGLALVEADQPGWYRIVEPKDLSNVAGRIAEDTAGLAGAEATSAVMQVFRLEHVAPQFMEQTIKPMLSSPGGNSLTVEERRLLIVTDYADRLRRVAELVDLFDRPGPPATIQFVEVEHWEAGALAQRVSELLQDKGRVTGAKTAAADLVLKADPRTNRITLVAAEGAETEALTLIERLDVPTEDETRTYRFLNVSAGRIDRLTRDALGPTADTRYRATVDEEAGLLVVTGPPAVHERLEALRQELDVPVSEEESHVRFYKLMNTSASEVLATIRSLEGKEGAIGALAAGEAGRERPSTYQRLGPGPNVKPSLPGQELPKPPAYTPSKKPDAKKEPSEGATPPSEKKTAEKAQGAAGAAAAGRPARRLGEATVTVDANTNTLIVVAPPPVQQVYERLIEALDKRRPQVMVEVTLVTLDTSDDWSVGIEVSGSNQRDAQRWLTFSSFGLSTVDPATGALTLTPGVGFNGTLVDPNIADVVLRALATCGRSTVLSAPRILVNDNATGTLQSVAESPFTSINASDTVATTSFAGYASAGTTVAVTPQISEGDHLRLQYSLTLNSFGEGGSESAPPPRQTDSIDSEVVVPDGYTVIVGGLKRRDESETVTKIPLLGDIPVLGHLFRHTVTTDATTSLFVFIRPIILRDDQFEDLKYLSDLDRRSARLPEEVPTSDAMLMH